MGRVEREMVVDGALSDADCEAFASALRADVGLDDGNLLPPHALAVALGLRLRPRAPSGCRAVFDPARWEVRYALHGDAVGKLRHELGHVALLLGGRAGPHLEEDADRVGLALQVPRAAVCRAWAAAADDLRPLPLLLGLPPRAAWPRVAMALDLCVIGRTGRRREVWTPSGSVAPEAGPWERRHLEEAARRGGFWRDLAGASAAVCADGSGLIALPARGETKS